MAIRSIRFIDPFHSGDWFITSAHYSLVSCLWTWLILLGGTRWLDPLVILRLAADKGMSWVIVGAIFLLWRGAFLVQLLWHGLRNFSWGGLKDFAAEMRDSFATLDFRFGLKSLVTTARRGGRLVETAFGYLFLFLTLLPLILLWFCGLALLTLRLVAPASLALSHIWVVALALAAIGSPVAFLAVMYGVVERCSHLARRAWSFRKSTLALLSMVLLASLLFFGPLSFVTPPWNVPADGPTPESTLSSVARYVAYCNSIDLVVAWGFVAGILLMLVHAALWPRLRRPLMAMRLAGIGLSRGFLYAFGIAFLLLGSGRLADLNRALMAHPELLKSVEDSFKSLIP